MVIAAVLPVLAIVSCGTAPPVANAVGTQTAQNAVSTQNAQGSTQEISNLIGTNPPFEVRLDQFVVTPDPQFDVTPTSISSMQVVSWNGTAQTLSVAKTPVLFVAYWCPHCQRTLTLLDKNWQTIQQKPAIVAAGYTPGTTLSQAKTLYQQEESALHLNFPSSEVYFLLSSTENKQLVHAYPELYFTQNQKTENLIGEHVLAVWQKAFS